MDVVYELQNRVGYYQVDLSHRIRLGFLFQLFQEAAIHHANQYEIGTRNMEARGESWILNRVALKLDRYPKLDEELTIQTWATSLKHFKGFREFRVCSGGEVIGKISTLWLYISMEKKAFTRLPFEVEETFPTRSDDIYFDNLDRLRLPKPASESAATRVTLRYSDIDGNQHVNNAAFIDILQAALYHRNLNTRPQEVEIQFAREIPPDAGEVEVRLEPRGNEVLFSLGAAGEAAAFGRLGVEK
ncbi:MAG: hypothetical protein KJT03_03450 [Verrucomicrobiae bacterium]|nr:hypothetical protein [Verrucomicrobiae bacterium]